MPKRAAVELQHHAIHSGQPYNKACGGGEKRESAAIDEMGEFEDAWEDEIESDEEILDAEVEEHEDGACLR